MRSKPAASPEQHFQWNVRATRGQKESAANDKRCTAPDSRGWCKGQYHRVIELAGHDEINILAGHKASRRARLDGRPHEGYFEVRLTLFHTSYQTQIALKPDGGGEERNGLILPCELQGFGSADFVSGASKSLPPGNIPAG